MNNNHMTINEAKQALRNTNCIVKDTSGNLSYGYSFAVFASEKREYPWGDVLTVEVGEPIVRSNSFYNPDTLNVTGRTGAVHVVFNRAEIEALIND